jgi:hypothetical protein
MGMGVQKPHDKELCSLHLSSSILQVSTECLSANTRKQQALVLKCALQKFSSLKL